MSRNMETVLKLVAVALALGVIVFVNLMRYNCCLDAGFTKQECLFFVCSSGR